MSSPHDRSEIQFVLSYFKGKVVDVSYKLVLSLQQHAMLCMVCVQSLACIV